MNIVKAAFGAELKKILYRAKYKNIIAIYAVAALGAGYLGSSGFQIKALAELSLNIAGPNIIFGALSLYRSVLLPLAIFMLAADVFTHELESGSIKCVITRPVSRFDAYLAKCCAILCYIAITLGVGYFLSQIFQIVIYFTGADQSAAGPLYAPIGAAGAAEALAAYALTLAPMAAFIAYACFISVLIRSPALVMFLCIASYIALSVFGTFYNGAGAALFTTYTSWYRMWLGERLPLRNLAPAAGVLLSTCVALFGFGYFIFEKRDI